MNTGGYNIKDTSKMHHPSWNKGKKGVQVHSAETREKIRVGHLGKKHWWAKNGSDNPNWKGGISGIDRLVRRMREYLQWRSDIFQRDRWTCRTCGKNGCYVTVHHIKSFHTILKENNIKSIKDARLCKELWDIDNGVTLCEDCHKLTDNYKGRQKYNE